MADQQSPTLPTEETPDLPQDKKGRRKKLFIIFGVVLVVIAALVLAWQLIFAWRSVSTDNAYVGADVAQVTPLVSAPVSAVLVEDTQHVKKGDVLVRMDDSDARLALQQAEAQLAQARRRFRQTAATGQSLDARSTARQADIRAAQAQVDAAKANFDKARVDYDRRKALAANGAVSGDELTSATNALQTAQANLSLAQAQLAQMKATKNSAQSDAAANRALTSGTTIDTNPDVEAARAARDKAQLDLDRMVIRAPISGVIAQRKVQIGEQVAAGKPLMSIVPTGRLYVDANFKEGQLTSVRAGQPVELTSDLYGGDVVYHGKVVGLGGGTGAAFALIPAQNATGNWIKVVQRLPVRVALDPKELKAHPLRVGLSMEATVDVSGQ
ncbi:HlyD family efflux transporter periplasmic adaptor subunit [Altericroceibacterium endophyticum]|uniref:HlyD family efflux transporter periplasmic adaptor subunit n=1 Tax=Altericroceibacterium endophyticum TaxID=1808508 RepID=A0A6I4T6M1_9SPHN|nr:HlyD family efflux transporter periplasmic adaptor subunit [Altericroceibacterium endophyticum]MXO66089.1 HlyD family efflux transporter periplasmic adaptor subunit [Altericroceibacterium endophyticum]